VSGGTVGRYCWAEFGGGTKVRNETCNVFIQILNSGIWFLMLIWQKFNKFRVGFVCNVCVRLCNAKIFCNAKNIFAKRKIFLLYFKNRKKTQIFRIWANIFFFLDIFGTFHRSMTHVWMTGCEFTFTVSIRHCIESQASWLTLLKHGVRYVSDPVFQQKVVSAKC
jgi:hypothetical protein